MDQFLRCCSVYICTIALLICFTRELNYLNMFPSRAKHSPECRYQWSEVSFAERTKVANLVLQNAQSFRLHQSGCAGCRKVCRTLGIAP
jgi:hypothetical protein